MAHYTREQLLGLVEQGSSTGTFQHPIDTGTSHLFLPKRNLHQDIYTAVMMAGERVTRSQIAKMVGLKKSPYLSNAIEALVNEGYLRKSADYKENQLPVYYYEAAD